MQYQEWKAAKFKKGKAKSTQKRPVEAQETSQGDAKLPHVNSQLKAKEPKGAQLKASPQKPMQIQNPSDANQAMNKAVGLLTTLVQQIR